MPTRVTLHHCSDGRLVVRKQHHDADRALAEAAWLAEARHSGLVHLLGHSTEPPTTLTAHVGGPTLRTAELAPEKAAAVLMSIAVTLADLHDRGIHHGAVSPDHIIVGDSGGRLCSPAPTTASATTDSNDLAGCVDFLIDGWRGEGTAVLPAWTRLRDRLADAGDPMAPRRAARALAGLAQPSASAERWTGQPSIEARDRRWLGVAALVVFLVVVIGSLGFRPGSAPQPGAQQIVIGAAIYAVGGSEDIAVGVPEPCDGQPVAVLLDRKQSLLWTFDRAQDGTRGKPAAIVPGATDLLIEATGDCPRLWALGPAGRRDVSWP